MNFAKKLFCRFSIFLILCTYSFYSYGFNWNRCARNVIDKGTIVGEMWFSSTSQFSSSTGDCAAIGYHSKENKKVFYVQNKLELQLNIAKGEGVYLTELNSIYGCKESLNLNKDLKSNYINIYSSSRPSVEIDKIYRLYNCKYL